VSFCTLLAGYKEEQINDFFAKGNLDGDATLSYEEFQHARSAQANKCALPCL